MIVFDLCNVFIDFLIFKGVVYVVIDVLLLVGEGCCVGFIGESGFGKMMIVLFVMWMLVLLGFVVGGEIFFNLLDKLNFFDLNDEDMCQVCFFRISYIF